MTDQCPICGCELADHRVTSSGEPVLDMTAIREALAPFAEWAAFLSPDAPDTQAISASGALLTYGDVRRARAILAALDPEPPWTTADLEPSADPAPTFGPWIAHNGGPRPDSVPADAMVQTQGVTENRMAVQGSNPRIAGGGRSTVHWENVACYRVTTSTPANAHAPDLARAVIDLRAEVARLTEERDEAVDDRLRAGRAVGSVDAARKAAHRAGMLAALDLFPIPSQYGSGLGEYIRLAEDINKARNAIRAAAEGAP